MSGYKATRTTNYQGREITNYPLAWPIGKQRTAADKRKHAKFSSKSRTEMDGWMRTRRLSIAQARDRLLAEVGAFTVRGHTWRINPNDLIISSNVPTRLDGLPYSNAAEPADPGVAVYFRLDGEPHCLPCDAWTRVADNLAAVAAHIGAMRGIERWGVGDLRTAFSGFRALPPGGDVRDPMHTLTTGGHAGVVASHLVKLRGTARDGGPMDVPMPTLTSGGNHVGLVAAFMQTYYGNSRTGHAADQPMPTIVGKDRIGLVTVAIDGHTYVIADIGMRVLRLHELLRAQFGEFADGWVLTGTQAQQVAGIGNSVCPHVSRAIVAANYQPQRVAREEVA